MKKVSRYVTAFRKSKSLSNEKGIKLKYRYGQSGVSADDWEREIIRLQKFETQEKKEKTVQKVDSDLNKLIRETGGNRGRLKTLYNSLVSKNKQNLRTPWPYTPVKQLIDEILRIRKKIDFKKLLRENKFNEIIEEVINGKTLTPRQANEMWNKINSIGNHFMEIENTDGMEQTVYLNITMMEWFMNLLTRGVLLENVNNYGSDIMDEYYFHTLKKVTISLIKTPEKPVSNKNGAYFPYLNTSTLSLERYQIYNIFETKEQCLIHALCVSGVSEYKANRVKLAFTKGASIAKKDLYLVAEIIGYNIVLHYYDDKDKIRKQKYKTKQNETTEDIHIAIHSNHYFAYEDTMYSTYSVKNYEEVKHIGNFHQITRKNSNGRYHMDGDKKINSLKLVNIMFKKGFFKKLNMIEHPQKNHRIETREHVYLNNITDEQRECKRPIIKKPVTRNIWYADCESYTRGTHHKIKLLGFVSNNDDNVIISNVNDEANRSHLYTPQKILLFRFLRHITKNGKENATCYFHNLKYDYHLMEKYLNISDRCIKDRQYYSVTVKYKKVKIIFKDSLKMCNFALEKFQSNFELEAEFCKKEAIAYHYYTEDNNNKRINISEYQKLLPVNDHKTFIKNLEIAGDYNKEDNTFNPTKYYEYYLYYDCMVLKKGFQKFNEIIKDITGLEAFDYLTISSLTDAYMRSKGAFDGVYEVKGNLRDYISKAIYGGRVHVNEKYKKKVIKEQLTDNDAVSLYPSAINRLCRENAFSTGTAKRFRKCHLKKSSLPLCKYNNAIMTVMITKVNKKQQMPFIAYKAKGSIKYTNEPPPEPVIIDVTTLEDYIEFHEIEYEILDGIYWTGKSNPIMGKIIQQLFSERVKHKKMGHDAIQQVIKLMLNSSYGKTTIKKANTKITLVKNNKTKFNNYVCNNFATIKTSREINEYVIEVESICADNSYNRGHIGCFILSMSKRMMNEVFDVANTEKLTIYYQDTDSMHLKRKDVKKLNEMYKVKYEKDLEGYELEQFHPDFEIKGACSEVYSTKSIFLGKKSYIDCLESTDKNGDKITDHHIRLKGITKEGIDYEAKSYSKDKKTPEYFKMFEHFASGKEEEMLLNPFDEENNKQKVLFEFKMGRVSFKKQFTRKVKF